MEGSTFLTVKTCKDQDQNETVMRHKQATLKMLIFSLHVDIFIKFEYFLYMLIFSLNVNIFLTC
jgi:hypothetical protein